MAYGTFRLAMITGFNTDVRHEGSIYHVQSEDRGEGNPVLESLVYIGGTIVAKKRTSYEAQLRQGATAEVIASLLKRQHQVIIAAIKAGRLEDLIRYSAQQEAEARQAARPEGVEPVAAPPAERTPLAGEALLPETPIAPPEPPPEKPPARAAPRHAHALGRTGSLNLDEVISDYLKRNAEQGRLDLEVLSPSVFTAGKNITLRVQVSRDAAPEADAIITVKIIGTAFKPQVFIGRAERDGLVSFNLALPAFSAGTAAIVIEAQSGHGRGELKHLIRRA